jgi:hypothetical protein
VRVLANELAVMGESSLTARSNDTILDRPRQGGLPGRAATRRPTP